MTQENWKPHFWRQYPIWPWVHTNGAMGISVYLSGEWDVHWGYDLGFDP